jgi:hypothetical protein
LAHETHQLGREAIEEIVEKRVELVAWRER